MNQAVTSSIGIERQSVFDQLGRIVASDDFRSKPILCKLLTYLVTESIEGRSDHIKGYSIGIDVFEQSSDFDPNSSALVRNNAVRLRALLKTYYLGEGSKDPLVIEVPKGGYAPSFRITRGDAPDVADPEGAPRRVTPAAESTRLPCIAVLPFRNFSSDPEFQYISSGLSQELADALARFEFRVVGMVTRPRDDLDGSGLPEVAREKRIDFWLDGDVVTSGSLVKLSFRLLNAQDNARLWSESAKFDAARDDLFEITETITGRVASNIGGEYGQLNQHRYATLLKRRPRSLSEQDILLKHYHLTTVLTEEALAEFEREVTGALEREPDSALLHACAAGYYNTYWAFALPCADEARDKFAYHAERAYALDPDHQWVLGNLATKCYEFGERDRFFTLFDRIKDSLPNSPLRLGAWAMWLSYFGEWEQGKVLLDSVFEHNVQVPLWLHCPLCLYYYRAQNYERALVEASKIQIPGLFWGPLLRTAVYSELGCGDEASDEFAALLSCRPDFEDVGRVLMGNVIKDANVLERLLQSFSRIGKTLA